MVALILMFLAVVAVIGFCAMFPAVPIFVFSVVAFYYGVHLMIGGIGALFALLFNGSLTSTWEERQQQKHLARLERIGRGKRQVAKWEWARDPNNPGRNIWVKEKNV